MKAKVYRDLGLSDAEFQKILSILKREPTPTELAMFSVEWSEHCGYPRSRKWLKLFPQTGKYQSLVGEDAGGIVYDGTAIIFKMESHNHPSQVEPKQGAATGVGGIIRDIFTSGARPIALFDSLRFGQLDNAFNKYIFNGVIDGIQFYGNCVGVPTVGGEIYFDDAYAGNCLVNVMCIGVCPQEKIARARAQGVGNPIIYAGSKTGRDGIGGCSVLASSEFAAAECEKRPTVQVGDPFTEKCLIEATLEALETDAVVGIKDMGAAGLTCSSSEMAAAGGVGIELDLDKVPLREEGMEPWEIMMSESQERMLLCAEAGQEDKVLRIFHKWGLDAVVVGRVIREERMIIKSQGKVIADAPTEGLAKAPLYDMAFKKSEIRNPKSEIKGKNSNQKLLNLLSDPNIASKRSVYQQYDHMVQTNTVVYPGGDAAVLRIKGKEWGIAATTDCNGRYCYLDPYLGAQIAVAEAARNLVVTGAEPAAVTDCLNFGNPEKPDRFFQFKSCVEGIVDACKFFELPVISGNVSFYNESPKGPIYPTPTIGMVGIIKDINKRCSAPFKDNGDLVVLLGRSREEEVEVPELDLDAEKRVQTACIEAIKTGLVKSAHDLSEGGLGVALAECSILGNKGALINLGVETKHLSARFPALLFGETQSRILLTIAPENVFSLTDIAMLYEVPCAILGKVGGQSLTVMRGKKKLISLSVSRLTEVYFDALPNLLRQK